MWWPGQVRAKLSTKTAKAVAYDFEERGFRQIRFIIVNKRVRFGAPSSSVKNSRTKNTSRDMDQLYADCSYVNALFGPRTGGECTNEKIIIYKSKWSKMNDNACIFGIYKEEEN